ncbi:hypothetical protein M3193_14285 [Sporosarcina luteola]|uniref:hypothetical protein n=1 Tax=Sporosarcina luteola TaxID=582850 RepID=UPI00203A6B06|nr:hypothetical protein [Sporosarcina luteola]MCM3745294.1 hypothetical protein [Sporosarcina luteola]
MSERMMEVGLIIMSLAAGLGVVAFLLNGKGFVSRAVSLFVDFIVFLWIGKIVGNFSLLIRDPVAVLAYPAGSHAFYIAVGLTAVSLLYRRKRETYSAGFKVFLLQILYLSAFFYEFLQYFYARHDSVVLNLLLYGMLAANVILFRLSGRQAIRLSLLLWSIGAIVILQIVGLITMFGIVLSPWFVLLLSFIVVSLTFTKQKVGIL